MNPPAVWTLPWGGVGSHTEGELPALRLGSLP